MRADHLAIAQDGQPVGDLLDLLQTMRDVDDPRARFAETANVVEKQSDLPRGERRGRLIQDQHIASAGKPASDLNHLLLADAQFRQRPAGIDVGQPYLLHQVACTAD